jgi:hypothetical protein
LRKAISHFGRALEYSGFGSEEELRTLLKDGESVRAAAAAKSSYTLKHGGLTFSVTPSVVDGVMSVHMDLLGEKYSVLVTAVYGDPGLNGAATRLDLPDEHHARVRRLVEARGGGRGVSLFVKGDSDPAWMQADSALVKLHELGIAASTPVVIRSKHRVFLPTKRDVSVEGGSPRVFGSPMHEGSDVRVGSLGELVKGNDDMSDALIERRHVQTLFESGEWALRQETGGFSSLARNRRAAGGEGAAGRHDAAAVPFGCQ